MRTIPAKKTAPLIIIFSVVVGLVSGVGLPGFADAADTLAGLENELLDTTRGIKHQRKVIEGAKKAVGAGKTRLKNAQNRHSDNSRLRDSNPDSSNIANAATRSFDEVIRAQNGLKTARKNLKDAEQTLSDLEGKEKALKAKIKKIKTTTPSLDEIIQGGILLSEDSDFFNIYRGKASQNNKEDKSIQSEQRGGVKHSHSPPMMPYP